MFSKCRKFVIHLDIQNSKDWSCITQDSLRYLVFLNGGAAMLKHFRLEKVEDNTALNSDYNE